MDGEGRGKVGSFLLGGLVGTAAALAAAGRMKVKATRRKRMTPMGLAAFEEAPCYREVVDREATDESPAHR